MTTDTSASLDWLPYVLQVTDPLFPTGGYAHSNGLESLVQLGVVTNPESVLEFLKMQVTPLLREFELPFLQKLHDAASGERMSELLELNEELSAWKAPYEARHASLQIGTRRLQALAQITTDPFVGRVREHGTAFHHLAAFAVQMRSLPVGVVLATWWYQSFAGYCAAALKLIRIGQEGCQRILAECLRASSEVITGSLARSQSGWFAPVLDIAAMHHERARERLFIS